MAFVYELVSTRTGWVGLLGSEQGLARLMLPREDREQTEATLLKSEESARRDASFFGDLPERLQRYFDGERVDFPERLDFGGATAFSRAVWQAVRAVGYGEVRSYSWLAARIGRPGAQRAVGQALGANPVPIIIPCHRVVGKRGELRGFRDGLDMKGLLLKLERGRTSE